MTRTAVANHYLNNSDNAYLSHCKSTVGGGKDWRGRVITAITAWMPLPESIKNDTTLYPTDDDWINYVTAQVDVICGA